MGTNTSNNVYNLSSANKKKTDILRQTDSRKNEFESLRNKMTQEAKNMGRNIIHTSELYDTNILKGDQTTKKRGE